MKKGRTRFLVIAYYPNEQQKVYEKKYLYEVWPIVRELKREECFYTIHEAVEIIEGKGDD